MIAGSGNRPDGIKKTLVIRPQIEYLVIIEIVIVGHEMDTRTCYIYAIVNKLNGKRYVGSSISIDERWRDHRKHLRENRHHCRHLQNAWNKYGEGSFEFVILAELPNNERSKRWLAEIAAIKEMPSYNSRKANDNMQNFVNSPEVRKTISMGLRKLILENPKKREWYTKRGKTIAAFMQSEEGRAMASENMTRQWKEDKKLSKRRLSGILKRWEDPKARVIQSQKLSAARSTPEMKKKISESGKKAWANPTEAMKQIRVKRWADPEARQRQKEKLRAAWIIRKARGDKAFRPSPALLKQS